MLHALGTGEAYERHQQELTGPHSAALRNALAAVLTQCIWTCLARLLDRDCSSSGGAGSTAGSSSGGGGGRGCGGGGSGVASFAQELCNQTFGALTMLGQALRASQMSAAFYNAAFEPGSLAAGARAAAEIARALPSAPPPDLLGAIWALAHGAAATFLGLCSAALLNQPGIRAEWAHSLEARPSTSASSRQGPDAARPAAAVAEDAAQAAWIVLRLLPRAAVVLPNLAATHSMLWGNVVYYLAAAIRLVRLLPRFDTVEQAAEWSAATQAMLRPLPLLGQLDTDSEGSTAEDEQEAQSEAWQLAECIMTHLWQHGSANLLACVYQCTRGSPAQPQGSRKAQLAEFAAAVHSTACRALHALAAAAAAAGSLPGFWRHESEWAGLAAGLNDCLAAVYVAQDASGDERR